MCVVDDPRAVLGAVADRVYGEPSRRLRVLGITGTNGKTTTAYLVEAGLAAAGLGTGLIGTVQTRTRTRDADGRETVTEVPSVRTTPEAPALHALLASMADDGVSAVVMEVSSHALVLGRVGGIRFAAAGFTNLGRDHLDFHTDLEDYFAGEGAALRRAGRARTGHGRRRRRPPPGRAAPRRRHRVDLRVPRTGGPPTWPPPPPAAPRSRCTAPAGAPGPPRVRLPGRFNVANAVLAVALLDAVGVPVETALAGIADTVVPGRMEPVDAGQPFVAVVDYAHTPDAVAHRAGRAARYATTGPADHRARLRRRPGSGKAARDGYRCGLGERCTGRDRRQPTLRGPGRDPGRHARGRARGAGATPAPRCIEVAGRREALAAAVGLARPGDTLLVAGKGHETGQEIAGTVHPFDDRERAARGPRRLGRPA